MGENLDFSATTYVGKEKYREIIFSICIMGYAIELSFDIRNSGSVVSQKQRRRQLATDYLCNIQYFMHEIEGYRKTTTRNDVVQVVIFETEKLENFLGFVKAVRKDREVHVECIYQDDRTCDLLYASPKISKKNREDLRQEL